MPREDATPHFDIAQRVMQRAGAAWVGDGRGRQTGDGIGIVRRRKSQIGAGQAPDVVCHEISQSNEQR